MSSDKSERRVLVKEPAGGSTSRNLIVLISDKKESCKTLDLKGSDFILLLFPDKIFK